MATNLALRPARWPLSLEKWYIGTLMADGSILLIYLGGIRAIGTQWARVTAELHRPNKDVVRGCTPAKIVRGGGRVLQCGSARIDHDKLYFETPQLSGQLTFNPRYPPTQIKEALLEDGDRKIQWYVEIPDADVEGRITWPGGYQDIVGRGFRDRVYYDMLPWRPHFKELRWGRAVTENHAAIWMEGQTPKGFFRATWHNGNLYESDQPLVQMQKMRTISRSDVVTLSGLHLGLAGPLLAKLSGHPIEIKQAGEAVLHSEVGVCIIGDLRWGEDL